ncbi:TetR/AcrR family transcriptional regulator [Allonocardiopsis opalescens]|uniref:TetR family transcriptional regulator n=1 Tax=Allonocardiopsis opalescens TaxID=1144618 RepID=A0A2T0PYW8_9ACTN|nr:TetR/AcrR family transcriptional regulator [Allonocardiopsis opalescens]PRX96734.1 TetR family transcriptional regulator [Allonocardiopsis opalescens]
MSRTEEQYEAMRAATRAKVEAAAVRLFTRRGYAATSVRDIAAEAGISTGLMYRHYATKEELFGALVAQAAEGLGAVAAGFRGEGSPARLLGEFTRVFVADLGQEAEAVEFYLLMNHAFAMDEPPAPVRVLAERHAELAAALEALIERGQRLGEFRRGDAAELAACYFVVLSGLVSMKTTLRERFQVPAMPVLLAFLLEGDGA